MINSYDAYVSELESLVSNALHNHNLDCISQQISCALDGGPSEALRLRVSLEDRRKAGAFFTGKKLIAVISKYFDVDSRKMKFLDPSCGAGDLLLACSQRLPVYSDLEMTIAKWGEQLAGIDIDPLFVRTSKARLILSALCRGVKSRNGSILSINSTFPNIRVGDGLIVADPHTSENIIMNPPYYLTKREDNGWGSEGKISMAALFLATHVSKAKEGTKIISILPDVLRTGTNYEKWRYYISTRAQLNDIVIFGKFDRWADVDVFILHLTVTKNSAGIKEKWWTSTTKSQNIKSTVNDFFNVHVGSVVPHRDPQKGAYHPYISSKLVPPWTYIDNINQNRRYSGRVFSPPFVVVRRTSRPGDKHRATGSIIDIDKNVAVENHLLVMLPKDRNLVTCKLLLNLLQDNRTNLWLDDRIRCRHLTVTSLKELPWYRE